MIIGVRRGEAGGGYSPPNLRKGLCIGHPVIITQSILSNIIAVLFSLSPNTIILSTYSHCFFQ